LDRNILAGLVSHFQPRQTELFSSSPPARTHCYKDSIKTPLDNIFEIKCARISLFIAQWFVHLSCLNEVHVEMMKFKYANW
jgi:hypothetical protein